MWLACPCCTLGGLLAFVLRDTWRELVAFVLAVLVAALIFWPRGP